MLASPVLFVGESVINIVENTIIKRIAGLRTLTSRRSFWMILLSYLGLSLILTWPLALHLGSSVHGYPNVDALDTLHLRGAFAELLTHPNRALVATSAYFPVGFAPLALCPNLLDHLSSLPFTLALPFPLGDNLWWLLVLAANGWAGHHLGRQLGGTHGAGALVGVGFATSEAILREANLWHAPQAMALFTPLYLAALLAFLENGDSGKAVKAGLFLALTSIGYWYHGLFLALGSLGLLLGRPGLLRKAWPGVLTATLLSLPLLLPYLAGWNELPITSLAAPPPLNREVGGLESLPESARFLALHGTDLLFPFRATPLDRSNRICVALLIGALLGARAFSPRLRWGLLFMALLGAVMLLGPVLKWGEAPVMLGSHTIPLPFSGFRAIHVVFERLYWPERWGILIPLALCALASRVPRAPWFAAVILVETLLCSGNAPLFRQDLSWLEPWRELRHGSGAVLELPLRRGGLDAAFAGLHQRYHGRPMVNPMVLPPGSEADPRWVEWLEREPFLVFLREMEAGRWPATPTPDALAGLRDRGVGAIVLDLEPQGVLSPGSQARYRTLLGKSVGAPMDLGIALVWWLQPPSGEPSPIPDPESWRQSAAAAKKTSVAKAPTQTLIKPSWWVKGGGSGAGP